MNDAEINYILEDTETHKLLEEIIILNENFIELQKLNFTFYGFISGLIVALLLSKMFRGVIK